MHTNTKITLKPNFVSSLLYVLYFVKCAYSSITLRNQNLHSKDLKRFALHIFGLIAVTITVYHGKAVQDDISVKTVPI